jgi:hypothetical protein
MVLWYLLFVRRYNSFHFLILPWPSSLALMFLSSLVPNFPFIIINPFYCSFPGVGLAVPLVHFHSRWRSRYDDIPFWSPSQLGIDLIIRQHTIIGDRTQQCCGSGSRIECFYDPWIQDPDPGLGMEEFRVRDPDPGYTRCIQNQIEKCE